MDRRRLGLSGLEVSPLCLGTMTFGWSTDRETAFSIMDAAVEAGINFFDTADIYSRWITGNSGGESEAIIGEWFRTRDRDRIILATKVRGQMWSGPNGEGLGRAHILRAVEDSLRRLNTDYIDLYQLHYPDDATPMDETLAALDLLVQQGKVRYIGYSNYPAWVVVRALCTSAERSLPAFVSSQPHYSLLHRANFEREEAAMCAAERIGVIPYSPLAAGFLTGKYTRENLSPDTTRQSSGIIRELTANPRAFDVLDVVRAQAEAHGVPMAHVALAWLLAQPVVTSAIIGARTPDQLQEVVGAPDLVLSAEDMDALTEATAGF